MKSALVRKRASPARANARPTRAKKVSLTVDAAVLREVQKAARRSGRTLSAHVTDALARDLRRRHLQALLDDYEAVHGSITAEELADVRSAWRD